MSERRIYKYQGTLIGDDRVDGLIAQVDDKVSTDEFEKLVKVTPTDINIDSQNNLILEHDGVEIAGQKKKLKYPFTYDSNTDTIKTSSNIETNALSICDKTNNEKVSLEYDYGSGYFRIINYNALAITHIPIADSSEVVLITSEDLSGYLKTLFGNQSLVGSGNIDLFCHMITITDTDGNVDCLFDFYSSKNLKCDSLADLKTLLGNTFSRKCNGIVKDGDVTKVVYKITESSLVFTDGTTKVLLGVTFKDVVKTI